MGGTRGGEGGEGGGEYINEYITNERMGGRMNLEKTLANHVRKLHPEYKVLQRTLATQVEKRK